jgi:hypothetical protein
VRHHGFGEELAKRTGAMAEQIGRLTADKSIKERCAAVAAALVQAGGAPRAARIVEGALSA